MRFDARYEVLEMIGPGVEEVLSALAPYEFATFQLGTTSTHDKDAYTDAIVERFGVTVATKHPDVTIILGPGTLDIISRSVFFYGRYLKPSREIPQTRWPCRACKGAGCPRCHGTGKMYQVSVEEIIGGPLLAATDGTGTRLHGCGREDIDARMLGSGRPFVLEVLNPKRREVAMPAIEHLSASFLFLTSSQKDVSRLLKACEAFKRYRALVTLEEEVPDERLCAIHDLCGATIAQCTPSRVLHRRRNKTRHRRIASLAWHRRGPRELVLDVVVASGFYVKEFVSGDDGRSTPSLADLLGVACRVAALDVLAVFDPTLFDLLREQGGEEGSMDPIEGARRIGMVQGCGCAHGEQLDRILGPEPPREIMFALQRTARAPATLLLPDPSDDF